MRNALFTLFIFLFCQAAIGQTTAALKDSALKYLQPKQYPKGVPFAEKYAEAVAKEKGIESEAYAYALGLRGEFYLRIRKIAEAVKDLQASLDLYKKQVPGDNLDVAHVAHNLGSLNLAIKGDMVAAEPLLLRAEAIKTRLLPPLDPDFIITWRNLGHLYTNTGDFEKGEAYYKKSLAANQKHHPNDYTIMADAWGELGILYAISENFPKAENACLNSIRLLEKQYKEDEMPTGPFNTLGHVYDGLGNFAKAEYYYMKAHRLVLKTLPPEHPVQYQMPTSIGGHFILAEQYEKAVDWLERALEIKKKLPPDAVEPNAFVEGNLLIAYLRLGLFHKAEAMAKEVNALREKTFGPLHYNTGNGYSALVEIYCKTNRPAEARVYANKMGDAFEKSFGSRFPNFEAAFRQGAFEWEVGQLEAAKKMLSLSNQMMRNDVTRYFPALSDHEKAEYFEKQVKPKATFFTSFSLLNSGRFPDLLGEQYNLTLATKALLLSTSARWKQRIKTSGDKKLFALYTQWERLQNQLANWHSTAEPGMQKQLDSTQALSETIEKELSVRSEAYGKMSDRTPATWKQVQAKLKPGEAAIEMLRFQKLGIEKTVTDTSDPKKPTYRIKGTTDTVYYAALIVKPGAPQPELVLLTNGNDMEEKWLKFYENTISKRITDHQSYSRFWEKIGSKLGKFHRVYFSAEGVYHHINLNTLFNPKTKKFLLEEKDIRLVTSTKDLLSTTPPDEENRLANLVGFPAYYTTGPTDSVTTSHRRSPELIYGLHLETMGTLSELPGTKVEVDKIAELLEAKGWDVKNYVAEEAMEENIKESYKPRLLHIATHGFFQPDSSSGSNPLLRSGLMLAKAGSSLRGQASETGEDGILTAYEAMNLNLDNTDLVVLSACETGLGEVENGEGVYGLQRAFKVAGAKSIIMSLWKVDDEATQELMVSFYKHWLAPTQPSPRGGFKTPIGGLGAKRSAFLAAQKELKAKYPNPYYWGAFVMVGE